LLVGWSVVGISTRIRYCFRTKSTRRRIPNSMHSTKLLSSWFVLHRRLSSYVVGCQRSLCFLHSLLSVLALRFSSFISSPFPFLHRPAPLSCYPPFTRSNIFSVMFLPWFLVVPHHSYSSPISSPHPTDRRPQPCLLPSPRSNKRFLHRHYLITSGQRDAVR
jgi:hypothetical protein